MKSSKDIRELEKLSAELAPKSGCTVCRLILIATVILFVSSVLLALFALGSARSNLERMEPERVLTPTQSSERIQVLREYIESQRGSTTLLIGKPQTK
jgi:hypothetical protein